MAQIQSIRWRPILNSHAAFTQEFVVQLSDGATGAAAAPQGETLSVYEHGNTPQADWVIERLKAGGWMGRPIEQESWDAYLESELAAIGRNTAYSLSLAFCRATASGSPARPDLAPPTLAPRPPRLCYNILNGGWHAYTNPVLSDFPEFLLVAKSNDIPGTLEKHQAVQQWVRRRLLKQPKTLVGANPVACFADETNGACFAFLQQACREVGVTDDFDLMVDASAGDLWRDGNYRLTVAEDRVFSPAEFRAYWLELIERYQIAFLEDPFQETDFEHWRGLTGAGTPCRVLGDNLYASDAARLAAGATQGLTHGTIIKPNQAGTVSATRRALEAAAQHRQLVVASHRSISTEETWVATLACFPPVEYFKVGPLATDYSSVLRLNEVLRTCARLTPTRNSHHPFPFAPGQQIPGPVAKEGGPGTADEGYAGVARARAGAGAGAGI